MPYQPARPCSYPGCNRLTKRGRCDQHRQRDERSPSSERGYDRHWHRLRNAYIRQNPICEIQEKCTGAPAEEVDHIRPLSAGGARLDEANLQSTCKRCHAWKTRTVDYGEA